MSSPVEVDDDFARFGAKSYAINKINSVEVRERRPHGQGGAIILGLIAGLLLLGALRSFDVGILVLGAIFCGLAYWQWKRSTIREYLLFLMTSSSETQAFVSRDRDEVSSLRQRIEIAMTNHSQGGLRS